MIANHRSSLQSWCLVLFVGAAFYVDIWSCGALTFPLLPPKLKNGFSIRGNDNRYGVENNSTIPTPNEVALIVGVKPTMMAPKKIWKLVWKFHGMLIPILHLGDKAKPKDSKYSLTVLHCKAIASMDRKSKAFDNRWMYDTLPIMCRCILRLFPNWLFPRLHHANIEARTAYLNGIIEAEIEHVKAEDTTGDTTIRLVSLGSGYDIRCSRLLSENKEKIQTAYELDLPHVVASKNLILDRVATRRGRRGEHIRKPNLISIDLNNLAACKTKLWEIDHSQPRSNQERKTHTIFISEGVMIYLQQGVPSNLLRLMSEVITGPARLDEAVSSNHTASFCFADRLENVPGGDMDAAKKELGRNGWDLIDWCPKPGLARHMGCARLTLR